MCGTMIMIPIMQTMTLGDGVRSGGKLNNTGVTEKGEGRGAYKGRGRKKKVYGGYRGGTRFKFRILALMKCRGILCWCVCVCVYTPLPQAEVWQNNTSSSHVTERASKREGGNEGAAMRGGQR